MKKLKDFIEESASLSGKIMYRGDIEGKTGNNPLGTYLSLDKKHSSSYGKLSKHKVSPKAKVLDLHHPDAYHILNKNMEGAPSREEYHSNVSHIFAHMGIHTEQGRIAPEYIKHVTQNIKDAGYHGVSMTDDGGDKKRTRAFIFPGHSKKM